MNGCNHDKCYRDKCKACCYCGAILSVRKQFDVHWVQRNLGDTPFVELTLREQEYFDGRLHQYHLPEGIKFSDLTIFHGKKTRVTIEVIE